MDKVRAPTQRPVTVSSMPSHLDNPTPDATAMVQRGQTAKATLLLKIVTKARPSADVFSSDVV